MPNGFHGRQEEWDRIEHPLRKLDGMLERFARDKRLVLRKNERNWPDRSFRWGDRPNILIQVFLESEKQSTYTLWISAADHRSRADYWKHKTLLKAVPIDELAQQLPDLLKEAYATANEWIDIYNAAG
ncbi:MAG: hypothetical protein LAP85_24935 [Acidobacteriia bacterium]|nr:hypothetical protein [Terriglobia bacterium]